MLAPWKGNWIIFLIFYLAALTGRCWLYAYLSPRVPLLCNSALGYVKLPFQGAGFHSRCCVLATPLSLPPIFFMFSHRYHRYHRIFGRRPKGLRRDKISQRKKSVSYFPLVCGSTTNLREICGRTSVGKHPSPYRRPSVISVISVGEIHNSAG